MKKLNKLFLGLASAGAVAAPIATVVSCGANTSLKAVSADKTMIVTDGGAIDDKSFNQQAAEALQQIKGVQSLAVTDYIKPNAHDAGQILSAYESAATKGATTILAPGFYHVDAIKQFNAAHKNALNFIVVDGQVSAPNVASILFDTKQPAFLAGYLAADSIKGDADPVVGMWGGGNFQGVTDYMTGFVAGIQYYNAHKTSGQPVKFVSQTQKALTSTGFEAGQASAIAQTMAAKADIILPVAGGQTQDAIDAIKNTGKTASVKIVGVDTDQSLQYSNDKALFLTSITKNISVAFKDVFDKVSGKDVADSSIKGFNEVTNGTLHNQMVGIIGDHKDVISDAIIAAAASAETENFTWDAAYTYMSQNWAA